MKVVVKIGGALIAKNFDNVINDISEISLNYRDKYDLVVVHGGGPQIDETLRSMNKEPKIFQTPKGFKTRYTDPETIEAAIMAISGKINKRLVEALQKKGVNALGLSGIDGSLIVAERKDKIMVMINDKRIIKRDEYSGKAISANGNLIELLFGNNYLPIIGCLAKSEEGDIVNVDGDRAASVVAQAIKANILLSLTDVEGIYKDFENKTGLIDKISLTEAENLLDSIKGGMKKKIFAVLEAFKYGIEKVIISSGLIENPILSSLEQNKGTVIENV